MNALTTLLLAGGLFGLAAGCGKDQIEKTGGSDAATRPPTPTTAYGWELPASAPTGGRCANLTAVPACTAANIGQSLDCQNSADGNDETATCSALTCPANAAGQALSLDAGAGTFVNEGGTVVGQITYCGGA